MPAPRGQGWDQERPIPAQSHCPQMGQPGLVLEERAPCLWRHASRSWELSFRHVEEALLALLGGCWHNRQAGSGVKPQG